MRIVFLSLILALAIPAAAQEKKTKKPTARPAAHAKPTPQQIRRFNELEKKEEKNRGRSPNSGELPSKAVRAPSPK